MPNIQLNSKKVLITTDDGSHSIYMPEFGENYHSKHGAIQESNHVYIGNGLLEIFKTNKDFSILEIGFGTGLNALLTLVESHKKNINIKYTTIDPYPLDEFLVAQLNYGDIINEGKDFKNFQALHSLPWEAWNQISKNFIFRKIIASLLEFNSENLFDLIYFDAFAPEIQPELWTEEVFKKLFSFLNPGGILVTYCCKGQVKRNLKNAGFSIEKLPGPPGKREMLRAIKDLK